MIKAGLCWDISPKALLLRFFMKTSVQISNRNRSLTLVVGLLAAAIVACTSIFQFNLESIRIETDKCEVTKAANENGTLSFENPQKAADENESKQTICKIQAVSQGVQLHVTYDPLGWESFEVALPEFKAEIPTPFLKVGLEFLKVLFTEIIAPNAP